MTEKRPGAQPRPFGADELAGVSGLQPDELAADTRLARELEAAAARVSVRPSPDFTDRVMAAVAKEPAAAPVVAARGALRHGAVGAFLISLRDAWRVTVSPAFPVAMRAQALALVLVVAGLAVGGGAITAGALGLFDGNRSTPTPTLETARPAESPAESPTERPASFEASPSPAPSASDGDTSAEPSESADPSESAEPAETDEPAGTVSPTKRPTPTPTPTRLPTPSPAPTPTPTPTADPSPSPTPDDEHTPAPSHPPDPTRPPRPTPAPTASPKQD
jgi:hypothetical protein